MEAKADLRRLESIIFGESAKLGDAALLAAVRIRLALWQRNYHAAEQALFAYSSPDITERGYVTPREFFTGMIFRGQRESARAQAAFLAARDRAAAIVAERPDDAKALIILAEIDARLGRKAEAIRAGEEAIKLLPVNKDAFDGPDILARLAGVLAQVGETSRALDLLERVLKTPSAPSLTRPCHGRLKMDDVWDPLRGDPRFEKIVASLAPKGN
jgi:tetratricopeptide (TPR) repeat protein